MKYKKGDKVWLRQKTKKGTLSIAAHVEEVDEVTGRVLIGWMFLLTADKRWIQLDQLGTVISDPIED